MSRRTILITCAAIALPFLSLVWAASPRVFAQTAAATAKAASAAGASGVGPALFARGSDVVEIPASFIGKQVFLPVRVNRSEPSLFRLDTSESSTSISPARLAELAVQIGPITVLNFPGSDLPMKALPAIEDKDFPAQVGRTYEGTLGNDFLDCYVAEIDYARQTLRLYDPGPYQYTGKSKQIHLSFSGTMPIVRAKVSFLKGKPLEGDFVLNTSLDAGVVISNRYASAHHLPSLKTISANDPQLSANGGAVAARIKEFQFGDFTVESAIAEFSSAPMPFGDDGKFVGEIGGGMLRRFTVVLDYPHQQLILTPNAHLGEDDHEDMSGISMVALGPGLKTFQITQVAPGSAAAHEQIQPGDVIVGIDQDPAADLTLEEFLDAFRQVGHKYKLVISHNGQTREVTIEMRRRL
jgi:PDZ domain